VKKGNNKNLKNEGVEIWKEAGNTDQSFVKYSDIADEFDYMYDPKYMKRLFSP
jgi:hypothetical protein